MSSLPILQSLKESILTANVKAVYGEPIVAQGKTVIPVAKIIYGYGGGAGTGGVGNSGARGEGGGGGGGARAIPVGVVEVSDQQTRFVPYHRPKEGGWRGCNGDRVRYVAGLAQATLSDSRCVSREDLVRACSSPFPTRQAGRQLCVRCAASFVHAYPTPQSVLEPVNSASWGHFHLSLLHKVRASPFACRQPY